jgi:hypothetical protein
MPPFRVLTLLLHKCVLRSEQPGQGSSTTTMYQLSHSEAGPSLSARLSELVPCLCAQANARTGRKFKQQIFLSLDLSLDPSAPLPTDLMEQTLLHLEKGLVVLLKKELGPVA